MRRNESIKALELSLLPAVLASSCCLTIPALALLGISFSENIFLEYKWLLRLAGVLVMVLSLVIYFYRHGVKTKQKILEQKKTIILITLQTIFFAVFFYILFLQVIVPILCEITNINSCIVI